MIKTISINLRPDDQNSLPLLSEIIDFLIKKKIKILLPDYDLIKKNHLSKYISETEEYINTPDLVVVVGGDGTFLRTARQFIDTNKPIFGINRGRLGFLTEFLPEESIDYLGTIINGNFAVTQRSTMEAVHMRGNKEIESIIFINDAVLSKGAFSRPIQIRLQLNHEFLSYYSGDGLIIATPTGSTAYSLSAGGPIITPSVQNIYIINPICPHALAIRPMIVSTDKSLSAKIITLFENLLLTIDGQVAIKIECDDTIIFRGSDKKIHLISHPERSYYDILIEKLGWGKHPNH